jgi:hypothetical protein
LLVRATAVGNDVMVETSSSEAAAGETAVTMPFVDWFVTAVAGHRFQGVTATPGAPVRFVREPDNAADSNAIGVPDTAGRRIGYPFREVAADHAALTDLGQRTGDRRHRTAGPAARPTRRP